MCVYNTHALKAKLLHQAYTLHTHTYAFVSVISFCITRYMRRGVVFILYVWDILDVLLTRNHD